MYMGQNTQKILNQINKIETKEMKILTKLNNYEVITNEKLSNKLRDKLEKLNKEKTQLYEYLEKLYAQEKNNVALNERFIKNQGEAAQVLQTQAQNVENLNSVLRDEELNQRRMVEINTYYNDKYQAYIEMMKLIVYIAVPVLIISFLAKRNILSFNIALGLSGIVLIIGFVLLLKQITDLSNRSNMNFNEYEWKFKPNNP